MMMPDFCQSNFRLRHLRVVRRRCVYFFWDKRRLEEF